VKILVGDLSKEIENKNPAQPSIENLSKSEDLNLNA
jgi:hypothetical protein